MKLLKQLEKSPSFWFLLIICLTFFLLRLPSLIEPYWYGDEGIYQVIGKALNDGRLLYSEIWDNKPPLLYIVYALLQGNQEMIRLASFIVGMLSVIVFYFLSHKLFQKISTSIITTSIFAILFAIPHLEGNIANAENFILFPIITAGFLIYSLSEQKKILILFLAGFLLGIAFLFKIVALFDLTAFFIFFLLTHFSEKKHFSSLLRTSFFLILGFVIPFVVSILYFIFQGTLYDYLNSAFSGNISYVDYANRFLGIPQGLLIFKALLLIIVLFIISLKQKRFSKPTLFVLLWLTFALFSAFFSQRPYTHYVLIALPSLVLFFGLIITTSERKTKLLLLFIMALLIIIIKENFYFYGIKKTALYYQNTIQFLTGKKDLSSYQSFFDERTPRDYALATIIKNKISPSDSVFIWGDSPQIYVLSHTLPPGKYAASYHISNNPKALEETQEILKEVKPKYIITLSEVPVIPFEMIEYHLRYTLDRALIYERTF